MKLLGFTVTLVCYIAPMAVVFALAMLIGTAFRPNPCWHLDKFVC